MTAFTLTSTAFIPIFGSLADTFGRYGSLQTAVALLAIGSILCAAAPTWGVLLLGRAVQGVGTAGVANVIMIILADRVSLREQAVNTSIFQLMNGLGYSVGPVIGGYLTNSNWRYCFVLNAGLSVLSFLSIFIIRNDLVPGKVSVWRPSGNRTRMQALMSGLATLDIGGSTLFILGVGLIILATSWGGSTYAWSSGAVIAPLVIGAVFLCAFIAWEYLLAPGRIMSRIFPKTVPAIPSAILSSKDLSLICIIAAGTGAALYSVFYFIGIYFTLVEGYSASKAGTQLLYYVPGLGVGVYFAMFICNVWIRQTFWPLFLGTVIETTGIAVLCYAVKQRQEILVNVMMAIAGVGTGMRFMPSNLHLAGMFRDRLAPAYSMLRFALPFGGTLALTIMGSVFQNKMADVFSSTGTNNGTVDVHNEASLNSIAQLPAADQAAIREQGATATMWSFISILPILVLTLAASIGLGNVWISKKNSSSSDAAEDGGEAAGSVVPAREDGTCARHAGGADADADADAHAHTTGSGAEVLEEVYLLALMQGNIRRLKKKAPQAAPHDNDNRDVSGPGQHLRHEATRHDDASIVMSEMARSSDGTQPVVEKHVV